MQSTKDRKNIESITVSIAQIYSPSKRKRLMQNILKSPEIGRFKPLYLATWNEK